MRYFDSFVKVLLAIGQWMNGIKLIITPLKERPPGGQNKAFLHCLQVIYQVCS